MSSIEDGERSGRGDQREIWRKLSLILRRPRVYKRKIGGRHRGWLLDMAERMKKAKEIKVTPSRIGPEWVGPCSEVAQLVVEACLLATFLFRHLIGGVRRTSAARGLVLLFFFYSFSLFLQCSLFCGNTIAANLWYKCNEIFFCSFHFAFTMYVLIISIFCRFFFPLIFEAEHSLKDQTIKEQIKLYWWHELLYEQLHSQISLAT